MIAWRQLKKMIPENLAPVFNESELSVYFPHNASMIELKGADNEDSLRGAGLNGLVIDEFATIYDNWSVWHEVLRPALTDKKGWCMFIGTPKGKDAFWELYLRGQKNNKDWKSWQFKTADNPLIDAEEIEEAKRDSPERYFRQEYEASFEDFTGLIYPEWDESIHVIKPCKLNPRLEHIGAIDTAITGVTGILKATVDTDGTLIIYSEYYEENKRVNEIVPEVKEDDITWYIDPAAIGQKIQKQGKIFTLFDEYIDNGIHALYAEKSVEGGINRVGEALKAGKIKVFSSCTNFIYEVERYHWAESKDTVKGIIKPAPYKKNDHLMDCLRYLVMSRECTRIEKKKPQPGIWSPAYDWTEFGNIEKQEQFV